MAALLLPSALAGLVVGIVAGEALTAATVDLRATALAALACTGTGLLFRWRPLLVLGIAVAAVALGTWRAAAVALPTRRGQRRRPGRIGGASAHRDRR